MQKLTLCEYIKYTFYICIFIMIMVEKLFFRLKELRNIINML